ncbi:MAG: S49 family peptidase [Haemophilus parainfluenzae]
MTFISIRIGQVGIQGLRQENLYFKSMLEKLEITPHIFRSGDLCPRVEPFLRDDMSPEAKANMQKWLGRHVAKLYANANG